MSLFGQTKRHTPSIKRVRSPLPIFSGDMEKKYDLGGGPSTPSTPLGRFFTMVYVPIPRYPFSSSSSSSDGITNGHGHGSPTKSYAQSHPRGQRYVRVCLPIPPKIYAKLPKINSKRRMLLVVLGIMVMLLFLLGFRQRPGARNTWNPPFIDPDTLILTPEELSMIWEWEVLSGHHPSVEQAPETIPLPPTLRNPAVPENLLPAPGAPSPLVAYHQRTTSVAKTQIIGEGPERRFLSVWDSMEALPGFAPRPTPGTILDLDLIFQKCDLNQNKYVRDCLEFLRIGGQLDNGKRVRRGNYLASYKQLYYEEATAQRQIAWEPRLPKTRSAKLSRSPLSLPQPQPIVSSFDSKSPCDPLHPKIFHMFWAGPFTDKPYMAVMSFLFTQNLGLDRPIDQNQNAEVVRGTCRPQFWVWINPGPAAAVPNPSAKREMYEQLATNPWSAPFLHERFRDVVKFRMWNTTEQLDGIPELKPHWRQMAIFNSGGHVYKQAPPQQAPVQAPRAAEDEPKIGEVLAAEGEAQMEEAKQEAPAPKKKNGLFEKVGSSSENDYDRLSVILSDMARFVLTFRFGGIYLDADTIFLRDWEELWNYRGQFAYRWSFHNKYNTAVLKLHKGSALGTFLFKSALENDMDFHPMTVSRYLKDSGLEKLLFRVPDALFDPAWLNMERYQRERPPFPYFPEFAAFFSNDKSDTGGPQPLGFDGFFRGAFSYHFHNFWWLPFDPSRNWPDLGSRFSKGEKALREAARAASAQSEGVVLNTALLADETYVTSREDMDDELDLSWSTVLKRTFEAYLRTERPNMYGEWMTWDASSSKQKRAAPDAAPADAAP